MASNSQGVIKSREEFKDTPVDQHKFWCEELKSSEKQLKKWHKEADKIVNIYVDSDKRSDEYDNIDTPFRLNLFHSNVTTLTSMLYGNLPKVDVSRRYADSSDDVSRVAAETMERLLNNNIADNGEEYSAVLRGTLQDRLLSGLGCARVRYEMDSMELNGMEVVTHEDAPIDYYFWRDVLWSWGRSFADLRWIAFRSYLTKDQVNDRFGEYAAENVELKKEKVQEDDGSDADLNDVWMKAEIWEIWDKEKRQVVWLNSGCDRVLDTKDDPLELSGFFPCPPFFIANTTTTLYQPTPDWHMARDLYKQVDELQSRIAIITEAVKVVGVYDKANEEVGRMFKSNDNTLIPVDNWALFAEKGGLKGLVDWVPIEAIVASLDKLVSLRDQTIQLLHQVTGMADVMRGGSEGQYEGVGQAQLKAKFGSVRVQALQDEFATFASDLLQLKAEVISRHFDPETIANMSNMATSPDRELLPQAIGLIKQPEQARLKVVIRPESVAMVDYAQLKAERTDYMNALSTFMQSSAPLMESDPNAKPFLLQLLQWGLSGFKGSQEIEGVIDRAIEATQQEGQQEKPDPEQQRAEMQLQNQMQIMQAQAQMDMQKLQAQTQSDLQKIQAKAQADMQVREQDLMADSETSVREAQNQMMIAQAEMQSQIQQIMAKMKADIQAEIFQSQANVEQNQMNVDAEIEKDTIKTALEIEKISADAEANKNKDSGE